MKESKCIICEVVFKYRPHDKSGKYCYKKECKEKYLLSRKVELICLNCHKRFLAIPSDIKRGRKFCVDTCLFQYMRGRNHHQYTKIDTKCGVCGKPITLIPSRIRNSKSGVYCSSECFGKSILEKVLRTCLYCHKEFLTFKSKMSKYCQDECYNAYRKRKKKQCPTCKEWFVNRHISKQQYCSAECQGISQRRQVKKNCVQCDKEYWIKVSHQKISKFCSLRCLGIYMKSHMPNKETCIERIISDFLTKQKIQFIPQYVLLNKYITDFFLPHYKLIIEADGFYWHNLPGVPERDKRRDKELKEAGYITLRLKEKDLKQYGAALIAQEMYKITL